jgi:putative membrane protein
MMFGSMWIFWIILIVVLAFLAKWVFQQTQGNEIKIGENALKVLERRYVKGEIDKKEFEQKKQDLLS